MNNEVYDITERNNQVDEFEALLLDNCPSGECGIRNYFSKDLYAREMSVKADQWVTSAIHKTEFLFFVLKGKLIVSMDNNEEIVITAPFTGISKPYSRRVAYIVEDTIWTTVHHRLENETEEEIEARIIEHHNNSLLTDEMRDKMLSIVKKKETVLLT